MDPLDGIAVKILGYNVKTRWQVSLNYLIPCAVELLVYICVCVIDSATIYQHFLDVNYLYALITLGVVVAPAVITFLCVLVSDQWPIESGCGSEKWKFFARLLINFLLFPICAIYRFSRKIFWCIEALFHDKNTYERHQAMVKAAEHSPFELYHFLQAFFHSAPQVILQLFILLRDDLFRNYDTAFVQALSVFFALVKMAMSVESFQRFESQKRVGKTYPWQADHQVQSRRAVFKRTLSSPSDASARTPQISENAPSEPRKTMDVNPNNFDDKNEKNLKEIEFISNITDDDKMHSAKQQTADKDRPSSSQNSPDDDLIENIEEIKQYLRKTSDADNLDLPTLREYDESFDRVPSLPPPPRPTSAKHPYLEKLNRLSTFKDMLVLNAENFIKENVPRIPEGMFEHHTKEKEIKTMQTPTADEVDFLLPTRKTVVDGIETEDLVSKFISFLTWAMFLLMRMISISMFAVFYPEICGWICFGHYTLMLLCLINETRLNVKWQRTCFYFILAYIFIFNLLEFKVKFKNVRWWYVGYFLLVMSQNILMTAYWYNYEEFLNSWWFTFMFNVILVSGILSLSCSLIYYLYLKPKDKVFFAVEPESAT